jgi:hypothetical protein
MEGRRKACLENSVIHAEFSQILPVGLLSEAKKMITLCLCGKNPIMDINAVLSAITLLQIP